MKTLIQSIIITLTFVVASLVLTTALAHADLIRVGVIDTGLDLNDPRFTDHLCATGHRDFSGTGLKDTMNHGTHIAGLIQTFSRHAKYCMVIIKFYNPHAHNLENEANIVNSLRYALSLHLDVINMSLAGPDYNEAEHDLIALYPKTQIVAAAGNKSVSEPHYPCAYALPNVVCVGAVALNGDIASYSNRGGWITAWENGMIESTIPNGKRSIMFGTSMSAAIRTGKIVYSIDSRKH